MNRIDAWGASGAGGQRRPAGALAGWIERLGGALQGWRRRAAGDAHLQTTRWLAPGTPRILPAEEACRRVLFCEEGKIWLTQGDGHDYLLGPGESLRLAPKDDIVLLAMGGPARWHLLRWRGIPEAD